MDNEQITEQPAGQVVDTPAQPTKTVQDPTVVPETVIESEPRSEVTKPRSDSESTTGAVTTPPLPVIEPTITTTPEAIVDQIITEPEPRSEATKPRSSSEEFTTGAEPRSEVTKPRSDSESTTGAHTTPVPAPIPEPALNIPPSTFNPIAPPTLDITPSTFDVGTLSDSELKAAATLYTKRNQAELSKKGVAKRQETMDLNLREIVDFLSLNNGAPLPRIAKHTNITPGTTSKYLRQLQSKGKVKAEGWGKTRRYYLK